MTISQSMDQLRLGLQTAKGLAWQAGAGYAAVEHLGDRAKDGLEPKDAANIGEQTETIEQARQSFGGAVRQALLTVNNLGLPATETQPLRTALESALREDDLGVFERLQVKVGWQGALQQLEGTGSQEPAVSAEGRFERASAAADSSEQRQDRIERYVDRAIDVLTDLEMTHGTQETEILPWVSPAKAEDEAQLDPPAAEPSPSPSPSQVDSAPAMPLPNPYGSGWGGGQVSVSPSPGWAPPVSNSSSSGDIDALSQAVWGDWRKSDDSASAASGLSSSTGNLYSDFLLDRGSFTPKKEDEKEEESADI